MPPKNKRPEWKELAAKVAKFFEENPKAWTQGCMARNKHRVAENPLSVRAVCWCMRGKAFSLGFDENMTPYNEFVNESNKVVARMAKKYAVIGAPSAFWNDEPERTVKQVINFLKKLAA